MLLPGIGKKALTRDGGDMASSGALRSGQTAGSVGLIMTENLFLKIYRYILNFILILKTIML